MRARLRNPSARLLLAFWLCLLVAVGAHAQSDASSPPSASVTPASPTAASGVASSSQQEKSGQEEKPAEENDQFRHAAPVKSMAKTFHADTETTAKIFEDINSAILIGVILFFLVKILPKTLRSRTETIQQQLIDARAATEIANERLAEVEAKLATLGDDIEAIRRQTDADLIEDERRIKQALEEERVRIVRSAEQEIASAGAAAQRELKRFAAMLAVDKAAQRIQLSVETDKAIVERFGRDILDQFGGQLGGRHDDARRN